MKLVTAEIGNLARKSFRVGEHLEVAVFTVMVPDCHIVAVEQSLLEHRHNHAVLLVKAIELAEFRNVIDGRRILHSSTGNEMNLNEVVYNF